MSVGSPPHVRGKVACANSILACNRITPACAGKRALIRRSSYFGRDHPRMCGEKAFRCGRYRCRVGSPPHVRGKGAVRAAGLDDLRITPACAGKSSFLSGCTRMPRDHPRMCGEKSKQIPRLFYKLGSPPHVRGKEYLGGGRYHVNRITPACAGKSLPCLHLRFFARGSPPHVRGKVADTGTNKGHFLDHPRMCGEKYMGVPTKVKKPGSPPHVRGKDAKLAGDLDYTGITPACAGKRLKRSRSTVPPVAIVPLFPSVCNKPVVSDGSPAGRDAPLFLPAENAVPASPAYNLRSL